MHIAVGADKIRALGLNHIEKLTHAPTFVGFRDMPRDIFP